MECRTRRLFLFCLYCHGIANRTVAKVEVHIIFIIIRLIMVIISITILRGTMSGLVEYMLSLRLWEFFYYG